MRKSPPSSVPPRNPFEIFGLTPAMVRDLNERDLFNVLKSLYRNLQKAFHPDSGQTGKADPRMAVELNLAYEELDLDKNLSSFRRHRKNYLKTLPSEIHKNAVILKDRLKCQEAREERLTELFFSYLVSFFDPAKDPDLSPQPLAARNVLLGLQDVAIKNNIRHASWLLGSNYKNIEINGEGEMRTRAVGRRDFSLSRNTILLGCVPKDAVNITPILERCQPGRIFKSPAFTEYDPEALPQVTVRNFVSQDNFKKHILNRLHPVLMESAYLFSLNRLEFSNSGLISLEGVIVKMENLEDRSEAAAAP
jgi:hypothetical protein